MQCDMHNENKTVYHSAKIQNHAILLSLIVEHLMDIKSHLITTRLLNSVTSATKHHLIFCLFLVSLEILDLVLVVVAVTERGTFQKEEMCSWI